MYDIKLNSNGDVDISETGDISLTKSIRQNAQIRLRWIKNEWKLGPEFGFPWFEDVFVKNPDVSRINMLIRNEISQIEGIKNVIVTKSTLDKQNRIAKFEFTYSVGEETFREELVLNG